jgi:hypothetical protein
MAMEEDAKTLEQRVYGLANNGELHELKSLLQEHPEVDVGGYISGWTWGGHSTGRAIVDTQNVHGCSSITGQMHMPRAGVAIIHCTKQYKWDT